MSAPQPSRGPEEGKQTPPPPPEAHEGSLGEPPATLLPLQTVNGVAATTEGGSLASNGGGKGGTPPSFPAGYLDKERQDALELLAYAAEAGIPVDPSIRTAVLTAQSTREGHWSEQTAASLLDALTSLAAQLQPVTVDSLQVCAKEERVHKTIRTYKKVAFWLAALIIPFSVITFITSALSEAIRKDIETANGLVVKLGDEVRSGQAQGRTAPLPRDVPDREVIRALQEFVAIIRALDARARQLNLFIFGSVADPFERTSQNIWSKKRDETLKEKFELPLGIPDFSQAALDKIGVYQDVRYFAQSIREAVSTSIGAMATCVLPAFYALLGACAFLLRSFEEQFKRRSFNPSQDVYMTRFVMAGIGGAVVGLFNNFTVSQNATIPPLAIAFLVGYAVDVFFTFLESLVQAFARPGTVGSQRPQTLSTPKS